MKELYGREIKIEFLRLHRPEVKFKGIELLLGTHHDVESTRKFHVKSFNSEHKIEN